MVSDIVSVVDLVGGSGTDGKGTVFDFCGCSVLSKSFSVSGGCSGVLVSFLDFLRFSTLFPGFWMTLFLSPSDSVSPDEIVTFSVLCTSFWLNIIFHSTETDRFPGQ